MKPLIRLATLSIVLFVLVSSSVIDNDKKTYKTIKIGNQEWMAENLDVSIFRNGDPVPEAKTAEEWIKAGKEGQPAWCYYENKIKNGTIYGKLYNWYAVNDSRDLAPSGWHIPSDKEWTEVSVFLGGDDASGASLKSSIGWSKRGNGTNLSGFSALPGGSRDFYGIFDYIDRLGYWWCSTQQDTILAWYRCIDESPYYVYRTNYRKQNGFSVRCVKD